MSRRKATPEQIAKAKEKREKIRGIAKQIAAMTDDQRRELVRDWPTTIEGHAVSLKNACLLAYQGTATVIGGFRQWKKAGRFVRKGECSKVIWAPIGPRKTDEDKGEIAEDGERPNFVLVSVFDISQTEDANTAIAEDERETSLPSLTAQQAIEAHEKTIWNSDGTDGPVLICPPPPPIEYAPAVEDTEPKELVFELVA